MSDLSPTALIVLGMLDLGGPATPYELKARIAVSVGNFWTLAHSQIYAEPERLRTLGLVEVTEELEGRRRKTYAVTPAGQAELAAWTAAPATGMGELRAPALLALFFGADPVAVAEASIPDHEAKLAEYEALAAAADAQTAAGEAADLPGRGPRIALEAGIRYEHEWIRFWSDVAAGRI